MRARMRVWRFRFALWRAHRQIAQRLGIRRFHGFTEEEIAVMLAEVRKHHA